MVKFKFGSKDASGNAKTRAILFFLVIVIIVVAIIGYIYYRRHTSTVASTASLQGAPASIESIPGVGQTSTEYVKLQEQQNIQKAQQAQQEGTSAVPTITRTSYLGPSEFQPSGVSGRPGCTPEELRRAKLAGVSADELRCKGCTLAELRAAGYTAGELAAAGFSPTALKNAGFSANDLRQAGFNAGELKQAGFTAGQLANAGYSPGALSQAGFSANDLRNAGINPAQLAASGIGVATPQNLPKDCSIAALRQAHAQGISAAALKKIGCGATALRAAGYTAAELRAAGFTPEELKAAGFSAADLKAAGFTAGQLKRAGFSAADLKNAGYSASDLKAAGFSPTALKNAGFSANDLKAAGYTNGDLLRAGFSPTEAFPTGAGAAGTADCNIDTLRQSRAQGISAADLRARGCGAAALLAAGYTPAELKRAGFSDDDLKAAGLTPAQIAAANASTQFNQCTPDAIRQARATGVTAADLRRRGCTAQDVLAGGYSPADLRAAGYPETEVAAGPVSTTPGIAGSAAIPPVGNTELQLAQLQAHQEQQLDANQRQQKMAEVESSMVSQANSLFTTWTPPATQQFVAGEPPKEIPGTTALTATTPVGASTAAAMAATNLVSVGTTDATPCAYVKGGEIMMAVLTSTVNSDENSPVMATIVSGKLRGAQLIGQFTLLKKKVMINFNKMNMPGKPASIGINAVALDPQTAHTALADCVNSHYWLRYGTLFASSFLSGLADAISQQGSQTSIGSGGILVTHDPLNTAQTIAVALGAVGSQYSSVLGSNFTMPPTVYVYAGDSIGVLFMQDLTDIPDKCCPDIDKSCNAIGGVAGGCSARY